MANRVKNAIDIKKNRKNYKKCSKCKKEYPANSVYFYKNKNCKSGFDFWCKNCKRNYDHERHKIYRYGISLNKVNKIVNKQENRCAICGQHFDDIYNNNKDKITIRSPRVDHNHKSGNIRGILCNRCNMLLGMVKDNMLILIKAAKYLQEEKKNSNLKF